MSNREPTAGRIEFIDILRGVAALGVTAFHIFERSGSQDLAIRFVRSATCMGWFGVPMFFVISGFVISLSLRRTSITPAFAANYALRRSLRLDPPYWFALAFCVLTTVWIQSSAGEALVWPSFGTIAAHLCYLQNVLNIPNLIVALWTLCIEVQFYLFMLLLLFVAQRRQLPLAIPVFALGVATLACQTGPEAFDSNVVFNAYRFLLPNFPLFAIGIIAWLFYDRQIDYKVWLAFQLIVLVRLAFWYEHGLAAALATGLIITLWSQGDGPKNRVLQYFGSISYSLYLIHLPACSVVFYLWQGWHGPFHDERQGDTFLGCLIAMVASIAMAALMGKFIEAPSIRLATWAKRMYRPQAAPLATSNRSADCQGLATIS